MSASAVNDLVEDIRVCICQHPETKHTCSVCSVLGCSCMRFEDSGELVAEKADDESQTV